MHILVDLRIYELTELNVELKKKIENVKNL